GTPDFAACSLQKLIDEKYTVMGVFCQPDRPKNRGHKLMACSVKETALSSGLPVFQPETLRDGEALAILRSLEPDVLVVVAYGRILPDEILELPPLGCVNVHASLLPKYRGSAPIQRAVLAGERITGVTTMFISSEMDAGDVIYTAETEIGAAETSGELFDRLAPMGAELLIRTLRDIESGTAPRTPQNPAEATYAPPLSKEEAPIDWGLEPDRILHHIYGMQPWPGASAVLGGTGFKVFAAKKTENSTSLAPGTVVSAGKRGIEVACGGGRTLLVTELQAAGGRRMAACDYLAGHPVEVG
ncbi:MAG: methionyl-tRNA formyltransferase, partial [Oscillospiraceae bacterium]|nr:methionyl-tRNA formyltransferase [Oscillospiraceae bacterium]